MLTYTILRNLFATPMEKLFQVAFTFIETLNDKFDQSEKSGMIFKAVFSKSYESLGKQLEFLTLARKCQTQTHERKNTNFSVVRILMTGFICII